MLKNLISKGVMRYLFSANTKAIEAPRRFSQTISKARAMMPLYKFKPRTMGEVFIAPNATVIGEVYLGSEVAIGHGTVIRGDINPVYLHKTISIGDNCVLHTAPCLPSGLPADLEIQWESVISPGCTLYSCHIGRGCFVGANSVILEGARLETGAIILPNSVVPPGRVVPANQVWGGNPIKFIRFAKDQQRFVTKKVAETTHQNSAGYKEQFLPFNNAYLYKPSNPQADKVTSHHYLNLNEDKKQARYDPSNPTV